MKTADNDLSNIDQSLFRDGSTATCNAVPSVDSAGHFLNVRFSWPNVNNNNKDNPDFSIIVKGKELLCGDRHYDTTVYVSQHIQHEPTFFDGYKECDFQSFTVAGDLVSCTYLCSCAPDYCQAVYVNILGASSFGPARELCEVEFAQS